MIKLLLIIFLLSLPIFANEIKNISLQLNEKDQFKYAGFYAAKEMGYYKKYNLNLTIKKYNSNINIIKDITQNKVNFATYNPTIIRKAIARKDIILLANYLKKSPFVIFCKADINYPRELKNKIIMGTFNDFNSIKMKGLLNYANLNTKDINLVQNNSPINAFIKGKIDAFTSSTTINLYHLLKKKISFSILDPNNYNTALMDVNLFTSKNFAKKNPKLVKDFIKATNEGWEYALENQGKIIDIILKKYNTPNRTKSELEFDAKITKILMQNDIYNIGSIDKKQLIKLANLSFDKEFNETLYNKIVFKPSNKLFYLTKKEKEWLKNNKTLKVGVDSNWFPYEKIDKNNNYKGIVADYLKLIEKKLNINFTIITAKPWNKLFEYVRKGDVDVLSALAEAPSNKILLNFTKPYLHYSYVVFSHNNSNFIDTLDNLNGQKIAIVKGYASNQLLVNKYPKIIRIKYKNIEDALKALNLGEVDYFMGDIKTTNYYIQKNNYTNLKIIYKTPFKINLSIGISKLLDHSNLAKNIFQKAINSISPEERSKIDTKWSITHFNKKINYSYVLKLFIIVVIIFLITFLWIRKLKKEVKKRKRIEIELINAREKALNASKIKSDFLANMSHEIRTPMNAIIGLTSLALKKSNVTEIHPYMNKILLSSNNLLEIINNILDFSKIENGKLQLEKTIFNIYDLLKNITIMFEEKLVNKSIDLFLDIDEKTPHYILGDDLRIKQIITNFLSNAIKFTEKGSVTIRITTLSIKKSDIKIKIEVIDTGKGIKKKEQSKLFDKFIQEDNSTTRNYGGTGLGLAISKELTKLMGGKIGLKSNLGEGSNFFVELTLEKADKSINLENKELNGKIQDAKILVVDDDINDIEILKDLMKNFKFFINHFMCTKKAMIELENNNYDLIILDWKMPNISGTDFYKNILKNEKIKIKPEVILISVYDGKELHDEVTKLNINKLLRKPLNASELLINISDILIKKNTNISIYNASHENVIFNGQTILLVEDNKLNQEVAIEILEDLNLNLLIANNGIEAINIFTERHTTINLILMDLQMPELDGFSAASKIRTFDYGKDIPIIALSADAILGTKEKVFAFGMNNYLTKPIDTKKLINILKSYLSHTIKEDKMTNHDNKYFPQIYGINTQKELERFLWKKDSYKKLLLSFAKRNNNINEEVNSLDEKNLLKFIHQLKGISGNIGIKVVYEKCIEIESSIENKKDYSYLLEDLKFEIQKTINSINNSFKDENTSNSLNTYIPKKELLSKLENINNLIKESDTQVEVLIDEFSSFKLDENSKKILLLIKNDIEEFEFDLALEKVIELKKALQ